MRERNPLFPCAFNKTSRKPKRGRKWSQTLSEAASSRSKSTQILELILKSLDDDKAQDIVAIDLAGKTSFADSMVIASGRSQRHVGAIADHLTRDLKDAGFGKCKVEGMPNCDWVLIDAGDVIVHLFRPEVRDFYKLEQMWTMDPAKTPAETAAAH
ncbi:MAG: ribosome silencing factor [Alphaproteobacteria bacterium]|nr:MAG: ribosome silencing factor [Alphaproteobacteria bacterium]